MHGALAGVERQVVAQLGREARELDLHRRSGLPAAARRRRSGRSASVAAVRVRPVATLRMVTVAPGSTACCSSVTTPSTVKVGVWAAAWVGARAPPAGRGRRARRGRVTPGHCEPPGDGANGAGKRGRMLTRTRRVSPCRAGVRHATLNVRPVACSRASRRVGRRAAPRPGTCAMSVCEPRQGRKAAALSSS